MEFINLTKKKYSVAKTVLEESPRDKNCYPMLYLSHGPKFSELFLNFDCEIYSFDYFHVKKTDANLTKCHWLYIIYKNSKGELIELTAEKLISYITPKNLNNFTKCKHYLASEMYNKIIQNIVWNEEKCFTCVYIKTNITKFTDLNIIKKYPMHKRIKSDIELGTYMFASIP